MSVAQFIIAGNWVLEMNFRQKLRLLIHNKTALILMSFYFLHLAGLINTTDFTYAFNDLRTKLPLLLFPFLMATSKPIARKQVDMILFVVLAATLASSLFSLLIYLGITGKEITDIRQISPLISHIRLALLVCVSVAIAFYFYTFPNRVPFSNRYRKTYVIMAVVSIVWLVLFLVLLESLTGLLILFSGWFCYGLFHVFERGNLGRKVWFAAQLIVFWGLAYLLIVLMMKPFWTTEQVNDQLLPKYTANGNLYTHHVQEKFTENGHYYGLYQCEYELRKAWNSRSEFNYDSTDQKNQRLNFTLMRFLTSRGLTKDSLGMQQLSNNDIKLIEQGVANYKIPSMNPLESRAYKVFCEYQSYRDGYNVSGHSLSMRIHYWQAAMMIIKDHFPLGVGTGDTEVAFQQKYKEINSPLKPEWRHRAHNQYLTVMLTFGLAGIIFFLAWLIVPGVINRHMLHPVYLAFMFVFLISMLSEDTLETQAGVSFAVFFSCLFLLNPNIEKDHSPD